MRAQLATTIFMAQMLAQPAFAEVPARSVADRAIRKWCPSNFPKGPASQAKCLRINKKGYEDFVSGRSKSAPVVLKSYDMCQSEFGNNGSWDIAYYCAIQHTAGYDAFQSLKVSAPRTMLAALAKCEDDFGSLGDWEKARSCAFEVRYGPADATKVN